MPKNHSSIQQIPLGEMERGLAFPLATLALEPAEIASRLGLRFESTQDDLDELEAAVIRSGTGRQFALVRHRHQPGAGTDILTNERSLDLGADLRDALQILQFKLRELHWTQPKVNVIDFGQRSRERKTSNAPSNALSRRKFQPPSSHVRGSLIHHLLLTLPRPRVPLAFRREFSARCEARVIDRVVSTRPRKTCASGRRLSSGRGRFRLANVS